jgi:hypothetical protein
MSKLLFLYNEIINPSLIREMKLPLRFVTFAYTEGKLYSHFRQNSTFILPTGNTKAWGNRLVYGAVFMLDDFEFYVRTLDSYHACSLSAIRTNHQNDIMHRLRVPCVPISFNNLDDLGRLKYSERQQHECFTYFGNPNHRKIRQRLVPNPSYRLIDGVDKESFKQLYEEVSK